MKVFVLLIILLFPFFALAHGFGPDLDIDPGVLPDSPKYFFERIGEWFEVNIFTLSTKQKQQKKLGFAEERLAEFRALLEAPDPDLKDLEKAVRRYQALLRDARDMAEKIIFLDGAEIGLAEKFEEKTRLHEEVLGETLEEAVPALAGFVQEALITARNENELIFKFMVKNYQFTREDIEKHQNILEAHFGIVERRIKDLPLLEEARKFQKAGLNIEAYDLIKEAKNIVY